MRLSKNLISFWLFLLSFLKKLSFVNESHRQQRFWIRGRCYDHNFRRFFPILGEKIGVFLKYQCYDKLFSKFSFVLSQKASFFAKIFGENI
jgi:hypothetical protein